MKSYMLIDLIFALSAAVVVVPLSQSLRLGAVPGFLLAGVVVGPYGLGLIDNVTEISHFSEIGVVLLLFVIGIELKPSVLWNIKRLVFGLGLLQVVLTGSLISCGVYFLFDLPLKAAVLIGPALALSSTAFVLQLLREQKSLKNNYGRTSIAVLLFQDLAVVPLLALIPLLVSTEDGVGQNVGLALLKSLFILLLVIVVGRYFLHPLLHRIARSGNPEVFTASALLIVLGTATITEHIGLSMAMGAFLAGLLISDSSYRHQVTAEIQPFRGLLLGLFFMSMGMSLNVSLFIAHPVRAIFLVALLVVIKIIVLYPLVRFFGVQKRNGLAVTLILAQGGEFALVLFALAFQSGVLAEALFQQLLLVVLLSMLVTPILAEAAYRVFKAQDKAEEDDFHNVPDSPIVIAGFGRVGRRIGQVLQHAGRPYVALDSDALVVERERSAGHPVFYGDVRQPELLRAVGAATAKMIIITLNDPSATEELVRTLRTLYPNAQLYARGHHLQQCSELQQLGAFGVVSENLEASLELARMVLENCGEDAESREKILREFRLAYYANMGGVESVS